VNLFRNSLAAVALIAVAVLLLVPSAEASRGLPAAIEPALGAPTTPDQVLESELSDPPERLRLFDDLRLPPRPLELVEAQKTASGVKRYDLGLNIRQTGGLSRESGGLSFQGLWTDPVTGISYARNRWYDARTASWLSEDPKGAVDSPNLYAFVGWGPHVRTDPLGLESPEGERALRVIDIRYRLDQQVEEAKKYSSVGYIARETLTGMWKTITRPWRDPASRTLSTISEAEDRLIEGSGEIAKRAVEKAIPGAEVDSQRVQIAELAGQGNTVSGRGGAHFQNRLQQDSAEIAERGVETGTRVAIEVGEDYLLGAGLGRATKAGRGTRTVRAIDRGHDYERRIRGLYGETSVSARQYRVFRDGRWATRNADNVARIDNMDVAIEAKWVDEWEGSIRNPSASVAQYPWAGDARQEMVGQARDYVDNFDRVVYHTNSQDLIDYYSGVFADEGVIGVEFVLTP